MTTVRPESRPHDAHNLALYISTKALKVHKLIYLIHLLENIRSTLRFKISGKVFVAYNMNSKWHVPRSR